MNVRRVLVVVSFVNAAIVGACVGDSTVTPGDAGPDATSDVTQDVQGSDVNASDADAGPLTITQVEMGDQFGCALISDGSVWCWGANNLGQLAAGPPGTFSVTPAKVQGLGTAKQISAGGNFACAVTTDARVWCWGVNDVGELGHDAGDSNCGGTPCNPVPTQVPNIFASSVSVGAVGQVCALTTNQTVVCWGANGSGLLGVLPSALSASADPMQVPGLPPIVEVNLDFPSQTACAIDTSHKLWCWGDNTYGEVGHTPGMLGDDTSQAPFAHTIAPKKVTMNPDGSGADFDNVMHVKGGQAVCAARYDGTVWCWGDNVSGALGNNTADATPHPTPLQVSALSSVVNVHGGNDICALTDAGAVWCWGHWNCVGGGTASCTTYYGSPDNACQLTPVLVSGVTATAFDVDHVNVIAITVDGGAVAWGQNSLGELAHIPGTDNDWDATTGNINYTPTAVPGLP